MEFGTSSFPESSASTSMPESKKDDTSKSKEKKKKSTSVAAGLAEIATDNVIKKEQRSSRKESYWRKLLGDEGAKPGQPEVSTEATNSAAAGTESKTAKTATELDMADKEELKQDARDFIEIRLDNADGQLRELPLGDRDVVENPELVAKVAEIAAAVGFLRGSQEGLNADSPQSASEVVDAEGQMAIERLQSLQADAENIQAVDEPIEVGSSAVTDQPEAAATDTLQDHDALQSILTASENMSEPPEFPATVTPLPPAPPSRHGPNSPYSPDSPNGPNGPDGPIGPGNHQFDPGGWPPPPAVPAGFRAGGLPTAGLERTASVVTTAAVNSAERAAAGRGLLVGGLVGYFVGRRRGKRLGRAESDKRSSPVRRGLERQVKSLQGSITAKENQIKAMARDTIQTISKPADRQRFVETISQPATLVATAAEARKAEFPQFVMNQPPATSRQAAELFSHESIVSNTPPAEQLIHNRIDHESGAPENLGRLLVEAPVAALAGVIAGSQAEQSKIIPFTKKAEEFTDEEVMATAEKVMVHGVSLKEMVQLGSLDERSVRRVINEFLEGGNVSAAVSREIKEKELKYERDPRMRRAGTGSAAATSGASVGGSADSDDDGSVDGSQVASNGRSNNPASQDYDGPRPQLDPATARAIRNKEVATIAGTVLVLLAMIMFAVAITG